MSKSPISALEEMTAVAMRLARTGAIEEAEACFRDALRGHPEHPAILYNLGALRAQRGDFAGALAWFERCRAAQESNFLGHMGIGQVKLATGDAHAAVAALHEAARIAPRRHDVQNALGRALEMAGHLDGAERAYRAALATSPTYTPAMSNLCDLLGNRERVPQAIEEMEALHRKFPDDAGIAFKLGYLESFVGRIDAAEKLMRRVLDLVPDYAPAELNLGTFAQWRQDPDTAIERFQRALRLAPGDPVAEGNLAHALLYAGDYARGWRQYESRGMGLLSATPLRRPTEWGPPWDGRHLERGTLLLYGEGGFGDVLQFCRYAASAAARAGAVVIRLERKYQSLARILASVPGVDRVVDEDAPVAASAHSSLSSLPYLLWNGNDPCPTPMPYLFAVPARGDRWRQRLREHGGFHVGLAWRGGSGEDRFFGSLVDRRRSIPFGLLEALFRVPNVRWHSLQKGRHAEEWRHYGFASAMCTYDSELLDFEDTAELASALDLVITVDTSVAHLAGGLGVPTWLLNRFDSCWRWGVRGTSTHWYPSMRLFRQPSFGDWPSAIEVAASALAEESERLLGSSERRGEVGR
ncbi:MAG TPA: tetratricopeptide repeat protein [Casimicrobiaceae bacterium]|nr:tetratricopeptide repeat protein [Casimicrobiaceae bacterium]